MTSGAIQHGVPTNVFRTLFLVMSPPVARKALTPKSEGRGRRGLQKETKGPKQYVSVNMSRTIYVFPLLFYGTQESTVLDQSLKRNKKE